MTVVHSQPHPLAQKYIRPSNPEIAKKFGIVRIEDWDDRVSGEVWSVLASRGIRPHDSYGALAAHYRAPIGPGQTIEVVRCHTQSTGELVLLHDDWIKDGQVIA